MDIVKCLRTGFSYRAPPMTGSEVNGKVNSSINFLISGVVSYSPITAQKISVHLFPGNSSYMFKEDVINSQSSTRFGEKIMLSVASF